MTDSDLMHLAAKAVGYTIQEAGIGFGGERLWWCDDISASWCPLTDDGDALRLATALGLVVDCSRPSAGEPYKPHGLSAGEQGDIGTLTRRAIVRAAAEIGRAK